MTKRILSAALALAVSISLASPAFAGEAESPFSDVPVTHWAFSYIRQAYDEQIISGMGYDPEVKKNFFAPDGQLTAAQFATIVTKAFYWRDFGRIPGETWFTPGEGEEDWYVFYKEVAEKAGLTEGTGIEDWTAPMTRYQMAQMLYNIAADKELEPPATASIAIADLDQVPEQYKEAVKSAYAMGLLSGMEDGSFAGDQTLTRAQAAVVFAKLDQALEARDGPMERFLDKRERALASGYLSYSFVRYPGKLGTAYTSSQYGTPHGAFSYLSYVALDGTEVDIRGLLPKGYIYDSIYHFDTTDIQFDETGERLSFVTNVQERWVDPNSPSGYTWGEDWGDTRIVINVLTKEVESMEPAEWTDPDPSDDRCRDFLLFGRTTVVDGEAVMESYGFEYPWEKMSAFAEDDHVSVKHPRALLSYSKFADSGYGQAIQALKALDLPYSAENDLSIINTPEQREQAGKYFQLRWNGELVSGNLYWTGSSGSELRFAFDEPIPRRSTGVLELWIGMPQEE